MDETILPPHPKRLAAFDFDYTVVANNTDTVIRDLIKPDSVPEDIKQLVDTEGWTRFMEEVFKLLHEKYEIQPEKIRQTIRDIPEVPGFVKCLKALKSSNFDLIVISDSNTEFINEWLSSHGLKDIFTAVYTNPARFDEDGLLRIQPFHHQTDCKLSAANLCKGKVLQEFIKDQEVTKGVRYENVFYVGDGTNDICPVLRLGETDFGCPRTDFGMDKVLNKNCKLKLKVKAKLLYWRTGFELMSQISKAVQI